MKVLFVIKEADFWNPLGLMQISSMAKRRGDETHLVVSSKEDVLKRIKEINPEVVAYSSCTNEHRDYLEINKKIKDEYNKIFTIMGGSHPTFFPEVLKKGSLDAICIGEGEHAFVELLNKLEKNEDISGLKNIVIKGGDFNGLRPLVQDLDSLPFPDRELFHKNAEIGREVGPAMNFMSSRGCPNSCTYCFNHAFKGMYPGEKYVRRRSVDRVIEEVLEAKEKYKISFVKFVDDVFIQKREDEWLEEFCGKYSKKIDLPFLVYTRFNLMTEKNAKMLKDAGCTAALMSIETPNSELRKGILKRNMTDEQMISGAKAANDNGISIIGYTMLGLPHSKLEDDINAVDFAIKLKIGVPEFPLYQPLPRTELSNLCINEGLLPENYTERELGGFYRKSVLNCFSDEEKNAQINISVLGSSVVRKPWLRNLAMNHLIYLPPNAVFRMAQILDKIFTYNTQVYKTKYSFGEKINIIKKTIRLEKNKAGREEEK